MGARGDKRVTLGRISGVHGVRGWVKVLSYTEPRENIAAFGSWILDRRGESRRVEVEAARLQGNTVIAKIRGVDDRDEAREWIGTEIAVERSELPPCEPGEYYWVDLEGLEVKNEQGAALGRVARLMATGANDVIVLEGSDERMIPYVAGVVKKVDLAEGVIVVDWEPGFWEP
ncbi:MAG TPA: ribosome maturation factor RimM [Gammaproteobacteria bacterium]|nr:ribosome maturation factor RimM [Gammaproteobacteria bacterium]